MKVLKFGGTSVGTADRIGAVADLIRSRHARGERLCVVVSAMSGVTNDLVLTGEGAASGSSDYQKITARLLEQHRTVVRKLLPENRAVEIVKEIESEFSELGRALSGVALVRELSPKMKAQVSSFGERISARILCSALRERSVPSSYVDAREIIFTNADYVSATVDLEASYRSIHQRLSQENDLAVITGFIASTASGETTLLGRGGSDYTAALVGAAVSAEEVEIWTDVDGVMTADPRLVPRAISVPELTYEESLELCHFGAQVIYPPTIRPLLNAMIPIRIKNTFRPESPGSRISSQRVGPGNAVIGIASIPRVSLMQVSGTGLAGVAGTAARLFSALAKREISVIMISQASSEHSICFAVAPENAAPAKDAIEKEFVLEIGMKLVDEAEVLDHLSVLSVVGSRMKETPGIAGKFFKALGVNGINVVAIAQGSSEYSISVVVASLDQAKALNAVHEVFFLAGQKTVNVFLVGAGAVGRTLLRQMDEHAEFLKSTQNVDFRLCAVADSKRMRFDKDGISLKQWKACVQQQSDPFDLDRFLERMFDVNLPNSIFVDCTADAKVANSYRRVLKKNVSVVTPNKQANAGPYSMYREIRDILKRANVRFYYEANVGAGLPVIGTIQDLIRSGDRVDRVEGVLSGTLAFVLNRVEEGAAFSAAVAEARKLGFTEPHPEEDLSGRDVARKLLILIRELGVEIEEGAIHVESLVPPECEGITSADAFLSALAGADEKISTLSRDAQAKGEVLRYMARFEHGRASVGLGRVGRDHPFHHLKGNENIVAFTTERYQEYPLVVRGPGAGAEVTAAGVLADLLRAASYLGMP